MQFHVTPHHFKVEVTWKLDPKLIEVYFFRSSTGQ